jgi:hypothetical protein
MSGWSLLLGGVTVACVAIALVAVRAVVRAASDTVDELRTLAEVEISPIGSSTTLGRVEHLVKRGRQPTVPEDTPR